MALLAIACVVCAFLLAAALICRRKSSSHAALGNIPEYKSWSFPVIGQAHLFRGSREELFSKYSKLAFEGANEYKLEVARLKLGPISLVFVLSPSVAEEILRSNSMIKKSYFYSFLDTWLGTGLLTGSGEKWKTRRRLLNSSFHSSILENFLGVMNEQARVFVASVDKHADSGRSFDISKQASLCALDIICETTMGKAINAQKNENSEYIEAIQRVNETIQERQKSPWLWPNFIFKRTKLGKEYAGNVDILHSFTKAVLEDRIRNFENNNAKTSKRMALLDLLLTQMNMGNITVEGVQEEVDTFMFAGHDTTAAAISWVLHMIGHHPEVQQKIQAELDNIFDGDTTRDVTAEDLRKMEYTEMVMKETLRMFPSVPIIGRTIDKECRLGGYKIPTGTECIILPYVINNNEHFWDEPSKFNPERFKADNCKGRHPFAFLSFSAGPRNCIGQRFAIMEEKVVLCHLLRNYTFKSSERTEDLLILGDIILRPKNGMNVKLARR